jgi:hypothetical protein
MYLQIPDIGDKLVLSESWDFHLYYEYRNESLLEAILGKKVNVWVRKTKMIDCSLPKGTVLVVDRVYIRKGLKDFSSLSFRIDSCLCSSVEKKRFWAKLSEVNMMQVENVKVKKFVPSLDFFWLERKNDYYSDHDFRKRNEPKIFEHEVSIYSRNGKDHNEEFKVIQHITLSDRDSGSTGRHIEKVEYIVKSLKGKILFSTNSITTLKSKTKELHIEKYNSIE